MKVRISSIALAGFIGFAALTGPSRAMEFKDLYPQKKLEQLYPNMKFEEAARLLDEKYKNIPGRDLYNYAIALATSLEIAKQGLMTEDEIADEILEDAKIHGYEYLIPHINELIWVGYFSVIYGSLMGESYSAKETVEKFEATINKRERQGE